jgi:hypothetical protein
LFQHTHDARSTSGRSAVVERDDPLQAHASAQAAGPPLFVVEEQDVGIPGGGQHCVEVGEDGVIEERVVGVEEHHVLTARTGDAHVAGGSDPVAPREVHDGDAVVGSGVAVGDGPALVRGVVVDGDDLQVGADLAAHRPQALVGEGFGRPHRHDHAEPGHPSGPCSARVRSA